MGRIAVMGAGAVGCYYGFKLARAGHDVVLIGRPQHVEAVEHQGLRPPLQPPRPSWFIYRVIT